jgi:hypothetical protein
MEPCRRPTAAAFFIALVVVAATAQVTGGDAEMCTIPPYAPLLPPAILEEEISSVQLMGRCFLACLEDNNGTNVRNAS